MIRRYCSIQVGLALFMLLGGCRDELVDYDQYESRSSASIRIQLTAATESEVRSILARFAVTHGYELVARRVHPSESKFILVMWRPDSLIIMRNPFEENEFRISIYPARKDPPLDVTMKNTLDAIESEVMGKMMPNNAQQRAGTDRVQAMIQRRAAAELRR